MVYAGNTAARDTVREVLQEQVSLSVVDNLRPVLEAENLGPAREQIHELFMQHVMAQAPGYGKLQAMTDHAIVPTPGAVGDLIATVAAQRGIDYLRALKL